MKKLLLLLLIISACTPELDMQQAKICVESYLDALKGSEFSKADKFYSDDYGFEGSNENRLEKMKKLQSVLGPVVSYQLTDSFALSPTGEPASIELTYIVKHTKMTTREKYTVMHEGAYKITSQSVENN